MESRVALSSNCRGALTSCRVTVEFPGRVVARPGARWLNPQGRVAGVPPPCVSAGTAAAVAADFKAHSTPGRDSARAAARAALTTPPKLRPPRTHSLTQTHYPVPPPPQCHSPESESGSTSEHAAVRQRLTWRRVRDLKRAKGGDLNFGPTRRDQGFRPSALRGSCPWTSGCNISARRLR
jgi:hypothetical protein